MKQIFTDRYKLVIGTILAIWILALFYPVQRYDFISLDDSAFVAKSHRLQSGFTSDGIRWAFTTIHAGNWHPLVWLSLFADHKFFGLNPGGYHFTNLIFHLAAAILLFLSLERMTKQVWAAAFTALLFGIHPLHVESVAWISEH